MRVLDFTRSGVLYPGSFSRYHRVYFPGTFFGRHREAFAEDVFTGIFRRAIMGRITAREAINLYDLMHCSLPF